MTATNCKALNPLIGAALAFALVASFPLNLNAQEKGAHFPHYTVRDLGTLGGAYSLGYGLNNDGAAAGGSATQAQNGDPSQTALQLPQTGFLWYRGHIKNVGTLGGPNSEASGPNAAGEAVILSETATLDPHGEDFCFFGNHLQCLAATWKEGVLKALQPFPGGHNSQALGLNDRGQVIGFAETETFDLSCIMPNQMFQFQAAIWDRDGRIHQLSPLPGDTVGFGFGINNKGQAVGGSGLCANTVVPEYPNSSHAVLWEKDGTPVDLGSLGGTFGSGSAINNRGDIDGGSQSADGNPHAFLWTRETGKMQDLGTLPGDVGSFAPCCNTINNRREIVGISLDAHFNSRAFLWKKGVMVDLNTLIPKHSPWTLQNTAGINESGQIVGTGLIYGQTHAFLATPCHQHEGRGECCEDDNQ